MIMWRNGSISSKRNSPAESLHERRVAVIFDNFGPYHVARLSAAAQEMAVTGIELGGRSAEYAWQRPASGGFTHRTLFNGPSNMQTKDAVATAMKAVLDEIGPDAIAIPGWWDKGGLAALRWGLRHRVPVVVMSESNRTDHDRRPYREFVKRRLVGLCSAGFAGGSQAAAYLAALGMPAERITTGYDAVDNTYFERGAAAARASLASKRRTLGLSRPFFLTCCRLIEKKNIVFLLECFAAYRRNRNGADAWDLVIAGDGDLRTALAEHAEQLGIAAFVHFAGFVQYDALPDYYGLAGAFVLPSTTEQWGLVVNEAMAAGLPVLVSERCGCAPDLVAHGQNGYVFDPDDPSALITGMMEVAHEADRESMGAESRKIIAQFDPAHFAAGLASAVSAGARHGPARPSIVGRTILAMALR